VRVKPIEASNRWKKEFEEHALLLWTGVSRDANQILKTQSDGFQRGEAMDYGQQLADLAHALYGGICDQSLDMPAIGELLGEAWELKKNLAGSITNDNVDRYYDIAMEQGAFGGKLLGAGGGGFLFFLADPDRHEAIGRATGLRRVDFKIEEEGSKVIYDG
jgi:D-glycero-alpha-D-manno-heptose-7-phosphate kinase